MSRSAQSRSLVNEEAGLQGFEGIGLGLRTRSPYLHAHHPSTMVLRSLFSPCPWLSVLPRELLSRHSPSFIRRFTFLQHPHLLLFNSSPTCWWIRHWGDSVLMLCSHKTLSKCQSWWACDVWGGRSSMVCSCEGAIHHRKFLFMGPYLDAPAQGSKEQGEGAEQPGERNMGELPRALIAIQLWERVQRLCLFKCISPTSLPDVGDSNTNNMSYTQHFLALPWQREPSQMPHRDSWSEHVDFCGLTSQHSKWAVEKIDLEWEGGLSICI